MTIIDRLLGRSEVKAMTVAPPMPAYHPRIKSLPLALTPGGSLSPSQGVTGAGVAAYLNDYPLSSLGNDPQHMAKRYLAAFKVGWFYKAESKISGDLARQPWVVTDGDIDSEDPEETRVMEPDLDIPFQALDPIEQFMRLMERPNPTQTGRQLRQKTFIRRDMAGWTFWYLEASSEQALPTAIYGISPARLWPSYDKRTGALLGWVLDWDKGGGTMTFEPWEIVTFANASAEDDDTYGVGVVEAVYAELPLTDLMSRHTADLLTTGGRLAGMMWPKDRALDEDEFNDAQRAWRNVVSDANSARRLLLFPEPMEWSSGASTPAEIGIPELAELNRTNILTAFPIAPEILGVSMPAGLNASGETRRELMNAYWSGTIEPRSASYDEVIAVKLLSRYEAAMGKTFKYETELPDLDDASSLLEKAGAFKSLTSLGFDDKAVIKAVGLDHIKWNGKPAPEPVPQLGPGENEGPAASVNEGSSGDESSVTQVVAKATKTREAVVDAQDPRIREFLTEQQGRVISGVSQSMPHRKAGRSAWIKASPDWWDKASEDRLLRDALSTLYVQAARGSLQVVADTVQGIIPNRAVGRIVADLTDNAGDRIKGINEHTLEAVQEALAEGTRRGYSLDQLIDGVEAEQFRGIRELPEFDAARAETIARTETMLAYNRAALDAYGEFGVEKVLAYDGDYDPECEERNGQEFTIEDALAIEDHPNGTLDWAPVTDKAYHGRQLVVNIPPDVHPAPVFNLHPTMAAPVVNVEAPIVNVAPTPVVVNEAKASSIPPVVDVRLVEDLTPPKKTRVVRDSKGKVTGAVEE